MRQQPAEAAAIVLAEEIRRRAAGPDHMAFDAVTWRDLGRMLEVMDRTGRPDLLPVAIIAFHTPGWWLP